MTPVARIAVLGCALGLLAGCGKTDAEQAVQLPDVVDGARDVVVGPSDVAPRTYQVFPGDDGRAFLVLECAGDGPRLSATRTDGLPWSPPDLTEGATASTPCASDGTRWAIELTGEAGVPVPLDLSADGLDTWRVSQTLERPGG